jgi:hypothetical protein
MNYVNYGVLVCDCFVLFTVTVAFCSTKGGRQSKFTVVGKYISLLKRTPRWNYGFRPQTMNLEI